MELAKASALVARVDGRNEKERAAKLRLELAAEYEAVHEAEDALSEARCAYKASKLEWDLVRYQLKALKSQGLQAA